MNSKLKRSGPSDNGRSSDNERKIVIETLYGDFNTDFINSYDQKCKKNSFYETFLDAHQLTGATGGEIGTCLVEESVRLNEVATPEGLKKKLLECDGGFSGGTVGEKWANFYGY